MKKPLFMLKTIYDLQVEQLVTYEKAVLFLDADNTLFLPNVPLAEQKLHKLQRKLRELQNADLRIVIISNNFSKEKLVFFAELAIPTIFFAKKPLPGAYRKARKKIEGIYGPIDKRSIVHIGDQVLTDAMGSIWYGIDYILVEPIDKNADLLFAKPSRFLEKVLRISQKE